YPTLSPDTDPEAERIQIEIFRRMPGLRPTLREWIGALTVPRAPSKSPWRLRLSPARPHPPLPSPPLPPGEGAPPPKTREKRGLGFPLSRSVGGRWRGGQGVRSRAAPSTATLTEPCDALPPLAPDPTLFQTSARMNGIGESPPRPDGFAKVSGAARYVDDVSLPGMWHGATLRSPHAHARIRDIRWDPARAPEGSVCVTAADLPGPNGVQLIDDGWPILADKVTLHVAEPVALVAAPTRLTAKQALSALAVDYEPLDPVLSLAAAEALPPLYQLGMETGDVEAALGRADAVIEGE